MKRKGFKSFVLKVCDSKGFADTFFVKCVKLKSLGGILASFTVSEVSLTLLGGLCRPSEQAGRVTKNLPSGLLAILHWLLYHYSKRLSRPDLARGSSGAALKSTGI